MSNEENKITTVEKTVKVKDPRKVELGKRLAKISREAKLCKKQRLQMEEERNKEILDYVDFRYVVGGLYFAYKKDKREIIEEEEKSPVKKNYKNIKQKCNIENL